MNNIISADFYRVHRGAALRNTFLGIVAILVLMMVLILVAQSANLNDMVVMVPPQGMSAAEVAELELDIAEAQQEFAYIDGGAAFGLEMLGEFFYPLFFLPIALAVFCADFSAGTYRNTLSFETNRTKVYLGKLLLSVGLCLGLVVGMVLVSWLLGAIAFGTGGFSAAYFGHVLIVFLLQVPLCVAFVAVAHLLVSVTKKSSATIAIFLVGYVGVAILLQSLALAFPALEWLLLLDPQSSGQIMAMYSTAAPSDILLVLVYHLVIIVAAGGLGLAYYRKSDMP